MSLEADVRIRHMRDAAEHAVAFLDERSLEQLQTDTQLILALVKCVEIIGEAGNHLPQEITEQMPEVPWPQIVNMRHRLVHSYFDINTEILYRTVTDDLPPLLAELNAWLSR